MGVVSWIVLGFLAGLFAGVITGGRQAQGCLSRIAVGVLGALVGGALARAAGVGTITGLDVRSMAIATAGAVLLLFVLDAIGRRR